MFIFDVNIHACIQRFGFLEENINILVDMDSRFPKPTGRAMKEALAALVSGANDGGKSPARL